MHNAHGSALIFRALKHPAAPVMALFCYMNATALKAMHKAGRRGGDSIARIVCKCAGTQAYKHRLHAKQITYASISFLHGSVQLMRNTLIRC